MFVGKVRSLPYSGAPDGVSLGSFLIVLSYCSLEEFVLLNLFLLFYDHSRGAHLKQAGDGMLACTVLARRVTILL
jgi:hypothetical protein